jgi:hypothetical protein
MIDTDKLANEIAHLVLCWSDGDTKKLTEAEEMLRRTPVLEHKEK